MSRIVERNVTSAVRTKTNVGCGNTTITIDKSKGYVILHGNLIATIDYDKKKATLFDGGFQSNVTKSRLNCVLEALNIEGKIVTRQRVFRYVKNKEIKPFKNGMVFSFQ